MPQTRPEYYNAFANGLGVIPRRGWDAGTQVWLMEASSNPVDGVQRWAQTAPQRLLGVLHHFHPLFALARFNDVTLAFAPGDTRFVALAESADGKGDDEINPEGTSVLDDLWERVGGISDLQSALYDMMATAGLCPLECVPGARGQGLSQVLTFDPLTVRYRDTDTGRVMEQRQGAEWQALDPRFCWGFPLWGTRDNPYGSPLRGPAMSEGLRDLTNQRRGDDILHSIAWPRLSVGFPFEELVQFAADKPELLEGQGDIDPDTGEAGDLTPVQWAFLMFDKLSSALVAQKHDDTFIRPKGTEATVLSGASGLAALEGTLKTNRFRLYAALLQLPGLMGETDGGTQAFTTVQYDKQRKSTEWIRHFVNSILVKVANLELRLRGLNMTARADCEPMASMDALRDQQAKAQEISNLRQMFLDGLISGEDYAHGASGNGVVDISRLPTRENAGPIQSPPPPVNSGTKPNKEGATGGT